MTLTEAFEYAKERTIRDSLHSARETQHPSYAVNLRGRHDLVLARIAADASSVELSQKTGPLELIHVESGVELLELPAGRRRVTLSVPPGRYLIRKQQSPGTVLIKEVAVKAGLMTSIGEDDLSLVGAPRLSVKAVEVAQPEAFETLPPRLAPSTPLWVKVGSVAALTVATGVFALGVKFNRDVAYYNRQLDPYRRFDCGFGDGSCDRAGNQVEPLTPAEREFAHATADEAARHQSHQLIAFGTTAVFAAISVPLLYRWIAGEERPLSKEESALSWSLLPSFVGTKGLAARATF